VGVHWLLEVAEAKDPDQLGSVERWKPSCMVDGHHVGRPRLASASMVTTSVVVTSRTGVATSPASELLSAQKRITMSRSVTTPASESWRIVGMNPQSSRVTAIATLLMVNEGGAVENGLGHCVASLHGFPSYSGE
jgi:hypothetical protein